MTSSLPPYSGDHPTCPKCGYNDARTHWKAAGTHSGDICSPGPSGLPERLERECRRCDYGWLEALAADGTATELELFRAAAAKIRELHNPVECRCVKCGSREERDTVCGGCGDPSYGAFDYPCPTLQALDAVAAAREQASDTANGAAS